MVPTGGLPLDVGVVVHERRHRGRDRRGPCCADEPLTHRVVIGLPAPASASPKNLLVPIGISYGELIEFCGGLTPGRGPGRRPAAR